MALNGTYLVMNMLKDVQHGNVYYKQGERYEMHTQQEQNDAHQLHDAGFCTLEAWQGESLQDKFDEAVVDAVKDEIEESVPTKAKNTKKK